MRRRQPNIAGLRSRTLAWAIDAGLVLGLAGGGVGALEFVRRSPGADRRFESLRKRLPLFEGPAAALASPLGTRLRHPYWLAMQAATAAAAVRGRNTRGLGGRAIGLRRVDLKTGGPVTVRAALIHWGASIVWKELAGLPFKPASDRAQRRLDELSVELNEIKRRHPEDPQARNAEMMETYRREGVNPFGSCGWTLGKIVLTQIPILITPKHQSVPDLVAGLVVVQE